MEGFDRFDEASDIDGTSISAEEEEMERRRRDSKRIRKQVSRREVSASTSSRRKSGDRDKSHSSQHRSRRSATASGSEEYSDREKRRNRQRAGSSSADESLVPPATPMQKLNRKVSGKYRAETPRKEQLPSEMHFTRSRSSDSDGAPSAPRTPGSYARSSSRRLKVSSKPPTMKSSRHGGSIRNGFNRSKHSTVTNTPSHRKKKSISSASLHSNGTSARSSGEIGSGSARRPPRKKRESSERTAAARHKSTDKLKNILSEGYSSSPRPRRATSPRSPSRPQNRRSPSRRHLHSFLADQPDLVVPAKKKASGRSVSSAKRKKSSRKKRTPILADDGESGRRKGTSSGEDSSPMKGSAPKSRHEWISRLQIASGLDEGKGSSRDSDDSEIPKSREGWLTRLQSSAGLAVEDEDETEGSSPRRSSRRRRSSLGRRDDKKLRRGKSSRKVGKTSKPKNPMSLDESLSRDKRLARSQGKTSAAHCDEVTVISNWKPPQISPSKAKKRIAQNYASEIAEEPSATDVTFEEEDVFSFYSWSIARQPNRRIQRERAAWRESMKNHPLYRAHPLLVG